MRTSRPRFFLRLAIIPVFAFTATAARAQMLSASSLNSSTPNDVERSAGAVAQLIERAEAHYRQGELNLKDRNPEAARAEFDRAVDTLLESGLDVRAHPRLQTYYLQLVERVYRLEVPSQQPAPAQTVAAAQQVATANVKFAKNDQTPAQQPPAPPTG